MKQKRQVRCYFAKKRILNKLIPGTIIVKIMFSLFIDFHGGMLWLIKNGSHQVIRYSLSKWIDTINH